MDTIKIEGELKKVDSMGRINVGKDLAHQHFSMTRGENGDIALVPVSIVLKREWRFGKNAQGFVKVEFGAGTLESDEDDD